MSIIRSLAGLLVAAVLTGAAPAALAQSGGQATAKPVVITDQMRQEFRSGFISGSGGMMRYLVEDFPEDYLLFETEIITAVMNGVDVNTLKPRILAFITAMNPKLNSGLDKAPDKELMLWAQSQIALAKILSAYDSKGCRRVMDGEVSDDLYAPLKADPRTREAVTRTIHASFEAARAGRRAPVERTPAVAADLMPVVKIYRAAKGDDAWVTALEPAELERFTDEERCRYSLIWFSAILQQPPAVAAKIMLTK
jgi:hypothetical protein